ncbi:DRC2 protein, partial [Glaucidium brasilianum]|nr:DRC2 protein [Glaucidium brasilianum]
MADKRRPRAAPAMAAEDEVLLLQSRALAEEEAAKRKGEMLTRFLKDKLAKEERSSALNLHRLHARWRAALRAAKAEELRRDIEILSQTFARVMDSKDNVIAVSAGLAGTEGAAPGPARDPPHPPQSLVTDLERAEEQHSRALRSHLHNIDWLLQLQRRRLRCLEEGYSAQLQALRVEFEGERYGGG